MPEWLDGYQWAAWLATALVLGVVEAATVDLVFLMLAGGALAGSVTALLGGGLVLQVVVAVVVATALLGLARPPIKRRMEASTGEAAGIGTGRYVGQSAVVVEAVDEHAGLVHIGGDTWSARTELGESAIPADATVRVTAVRGATLIVTPATPVRDIITRGE